MEVTIQDILERQEILLKPNDMDTQEYKIKGWVAKDEDNAVFFHINHPHREPMVTLTSERIGIWQSYNERFR